MHGVPGPTDLWGKFRNKPEHGGPAWHPLVDHCIDVACVLEALLAQPTIRRRLARAGQCGELDEVQVARLCFLAFLHDLGKCAAGFRAKAAERPMAVCGHIAALKGLCETELTTRFLEAIDGRVLVGWGETVVQELLIAAFAHHGRPVDLHYNSAEDSHLLATWLPRGNDDPLAHMATLAAAGMDPCWGLRPRPR